MHWEGSSFTQAWWKTVPFGPQPRAPSVPEAPSSYRLFFFFLFLFLLFYDSGFNHEDTQQPVVHTSAHVLPCWHPSANHPPFGALHLSQPQHNIGL